MLARRHTLLLLAVLALGSLLSGCANANTAEGNTVPWGRPQQWEGGLPGMGSFTGNSGTTTGGNGLR